MEEVVVLLGLVCTTSVLLTMENRGNLARDLARHPYYNGFSGKDGAGQRM